MRARTGTHTHTHTHTHATAHSVVCDWLAQWHWYNSSEGVQSLNRRFEGRARQAKNSDQLQENCSGWCSSANTQSAEVKEKTYFFFPAQKLVSYLTMSVWTAVVLNGGVISQYHAAYWFINTLWSILFRNFIKERGWIMCIKPFVLQIIKSRFMSKQILYFFF